MSTDTPTPCNCGAPDAFALTPGERIAHSPDGCTIEAADTPTPERVTLTDEEHEALLVAVCTLGAAEHEHRHEARMAQLAPAVERILAAREQALREEIVGEIEAEAHPFRALADPDGHRATLTAARIARGGVR